MSYPPNPGGYPSYPPSQSGPGAGIGFAPLNSQPMGSGPGYPLYPQDGGGFPCPPSSQGPGSFVSSAAPQNPLQSTPYSAFSSGPQDGACYQQPLNSVPYPNQSSPYPPQPNSFSPSYPPQPNPSFQNQQIYPNLQGAPPQTGYPYPPNQFQDPVASNTSSAAYGAPPASQYSSPYAQGTPQSYNPGTMWPYQERPTVKPAMSFDPSTDAAQLRKAMKGFGTDEAAIIRILGRRPSQQRQQILLRYQQSFGRDLIKDLKKELSGQFEAVILALMIPLYTYLAQELNNAIMGIGTNEKTLIEILCTNDNNTLRGIKTMYQNTYGRSIEADLRGDTSGDFRKLLVAMAAASRDEMCNDCSLAPGLAQSLYKAGAKKMGTDEVEFRRIMSTYSYPVLRCTFDEYRKISGGKTFEQSIKSELSGDFREGMLGIYECINNRASYFARLIYEAMRGFGTHDRALIRIIVSRSEIDMGNIKDEYRKKYGKRLEDAITSDTSGDYKRILLALIQD